jgi:phosphinothricin acetyltransferase
VTNQLNIRFAQPEDLSATVKIFNQAVRARLNGSLKEFTVEEKKPWFSKFNKDKYPIYVAELNGNIVGYCYLSAYRSGRQAMNKIAEISYYIHFDHHRKGIASKLIEYAILDCKRLGKESLLAILLDTNKPSIAILEKFNFKKWGHYPDIIDLDGKQCGQLIYGLKL